MGGRQSSRLDALLHYGLAAFEGLRCYKGKSGSAIFKLQEHVDRLFESATSA